VNVRAIAGLQAVIIPSGRRSSIPKNNYKKKQRRPPSKKKKIGKNLSPRNRKPCHSISIALMQSVEEHELHTRSGFVCQASIGNDLKLF
jgi:hypothetical protein